MMPAMEPIAGGPDALHLVIGGARSGKSAHAQSMAVAHEAAGRTVCVIATALAADAEMRARIARHRADRPSHWPVVELPQAPRALAAALDAHAAPGHCVLVDCLTLWLSQAIAPPPGHAPLDAADETAALMEALGRAAGPVLLVGNEIGLGVVPPDPLTRRVVDALGHAHQRIAALAGRVTWMVAGLPVELKTPRSSGPAGAPGAPAARLRAAAEEGRGPGRAAASGGDAGPPADGAGRAAMRSAAGERPTAGPPGAAAGGSRGAGVRRGRSR